MLSEEIASAQRLVKTDAYQMSIGEIVSMYENSELIIDPEFQRLFRWTIGQKSKLIESLLLGIPLPSIFVFEKENGTWELVDGLQRVSTILEFMGKLRSPEGGLSVPSILEATKYLPSLHNAVWERSDRIPDISPEDQIELDRNQQLSIRRARMGVEILKRPSENQTKFDLFQRLNAGGTQANAQELRNCIMLMVNVDYYRAVKRAAEREPFQSVVGVKEEHIERQRHMELAVRFLVHVGIAYDGKLDVEEYIDEGIVRLAGASNGAAAEDLINRTFALLNEAAGSNALRRFENGNYVGKIGLVGLEGIAVGVAKNLAGILALDHPAEFVLDRSQMFWASPVAESFTSPLDVFNASRRYLRANEDFHFSLAGETITKERAQNLEKNVRRLIGREIGPKEALRLLVDEIINTSKWCNGVGSKILGFCIPKKGAQLFFEKGKTVTLAAQPNAETTSFSYFEEGYSELKQYGPTIVCGGSAVTDVQTANDPSRDFQSAEVRILSLPKSNSTNRKS